MSGGPAPVSAAPTATDTYTESDEHTSDIFSDYSCSSLPFTARAHPGHITESSTLSAIQLPTPTYPLLDSLPKHLIDSGLLSALQLESILYACQRHTCFLPDGSRAGFFIADGAGVGKGRQIAGIMADNFYRGRKKHVWISASTDLYHDAKRDLADISLHINLIKGLQQLDAAGKKALGMSADFKEGVLFSTYASLISTRGKKKRLQQLIEWCGADFDGCLVFDESHKAKNFIDGESESSTKIGLAVVELQQRLPKARVVYCSATGITELKNTAFMVRLGIWGPSSPFESFPAFVNEISKRGLGALELISMELKHGGIYVSRGLSYQNCQFSSLNAELTADQIAMYDAATRYWRRLKDAEEKAIAITQAPSREWRVFWGAFTRFFKCLCISLKLPTVFREAKKALEDGMAVVIGLQTTAESALRHDLELRGEKTGAKGHSHALPETIAQQFNSFPCLCKLMADRFLRVHFPVARLERIAITPTQSQSLATTLIQPDNPYAYFPSDDESEAAEDPAEAAFFRSRFGEGTPAPSSTPQPSSATPSATPQPDNTTYEERYVEIPELVELRAQLLKELHALDLPPAPIDLMIDELGGPQNVAELTGRTARMVRNRAGQIVYEPRVHQHKQSAGIDMEESLQDVNIAEKNDFMADKKRVAIISDAASTGISLHADLACKNQRRRLHITVELAWSADKTIQQLGRTHRSNEASGPIYMLVTTKVAGEKRFASAVAKRLASLAALTRGDRRAAVGGNDMGLENNLETTLGRQALKLCVDNVFRGHDTISATAAVPQALPTVPATGSDSAQGDIDAVDGSSDDEMKGQEAEVDAAFDVKALDFASVAESLDTIGISARDEKLQVKTFLNRILGLPIAQQNELFNYFFYVLSHLTTVAIKNGTHSEGVGSVRASRITLHRVETLVANHNKLPPPPQPAPSPFVNCLTLPTAEVIQAIIAANPHITLPQLQAMFSIPQPQLIAPRSTPSVPVQVMAKSPDTKLYVLNLDRGISYETALTNLQRAQEEGTSQLSGFYESKNPMFGRTLVLLAVEGGTKNSFVIYRPNTGLQPHEDIKAELLPRYRKISLSAAKALWDTAYQASLNTCMHGPACKSGRFCNSGKRLTKLHLLVGNCLSYFSTLSSFVGAAAQDNTDRQMKVVRVNIDEVESKADGAKSKQNGDSNHPSRLVGLRVPETVINRLKDELPSLVIPHGIGSVASIEQPVPVQPALVSKYSKPKATILTFFNKSETAQPSAAPASEPFKPAIKKQSSLPFTAPQPTTVTKSVRSTTMSSFFKPATKPATTVTSMFIAKRDHTITAHSRLSAPFSSTDCIDLLSEPDDSNMHTTANSNKRVAHGHTDLHSRSHTADVNKRSKLEHDSLTAAAAAAPRDASADVLDMPILENDMPTLENA